MKKIYEAVGKEKESILDVSNECRAFDRQLYSRDEVGESDLIMVSRIKQFPSKNKVISKDDTVAQRNLEKGITPNKEAARFDRESNELTQCICMNRRNLKHPHFETINNKEYDMLLLFSDGVTDCLSDDDIAVVCKNSNRKEVARKIVEKAIRHDSIEPEEYMDYENLELYIPGGKDNTTAAVYAPKKDDEIEM